MLGEGLQSRARDLISCSYVHGEPKTRKRATADLLSVELLVHRNLGIMTHFKMDHDATMELMMELIQNICPTDY